LGGGEPGRGKKPVQLRRGPKGGQEEKRGRVEQKKRGVAKASVKLLLKVL